jgi:hypothetical protein
MAHFERVKPLALMLATLTAAATAASAAPPRTGSLRVLSERPLVVSGSGFAPRERVLLRIALGQVWTRRAVATSRGAFLARFRMSIPRCRGYEVQAFGSRGTRARFVSRLHEDCNPEA